MEEQIAAVRAIYWSKEALLERERLLAEPRALAKAARERQKLGRRGKGEEIEAAADEAAA